MRRQADDDQCSPSSNTEVVRIHFEHWESYAKVRHSLSMATYTEVGTTRPGRKQSQPRAAADGNGQTEWILAPDRRD